MTSNTHGVFVKAAEKTLVEWFSGQWDRQKQDVDDLVQDLWVWYLENPSTRHKLNLLSEPEAVKTACLRAHQLLSRQTLDSNTFNGRNLFSTDSVKEALKKKSTNKYLQTVLPLAMQQLQHDDDKAEAAGRHRGYVEVLRSRYEDGVVPKGPAADSLSKAVKSLTDEINVLYITSEVQGVGSRSAVFPSTRRTAGGHSDPTPNIALALMGNAELRDQYLDETPWGQIVRGAAAEPVFDIGPVKFRREARC